MSLEELIDKTNNTNNALILLSNVSNFQRAIHFNLNHKIIFGSYAFHDNNCSIVIINPDLSKINFEGFNDVYVIDSLIDCKFIFHNCMGNYDGINWHICRFEVSKDISFIKTIFPDRVNLEELFIYLKKLYANKIKQINLQQLSSALHICTLTAYYCLKILNEINAVSISLYKDTDMLFKINNVCKKSLDESHILKKLNWFINNLNKINTHFRSNKGEQP
jgi:hypothetical protein